MSHFDDREDQAERFKRAARETSVGLDEDKLKDALRRLAPERPKVDPPTDKEKGK